MVHVLPVPASLADPESQVRQALLYLIIHQLLASYENTRLRIFGVVIWISNFNNIFLLQGSIKGETLRVKQHHSSSLELEWFKGESLPKSGLGKTSTQPVFLSDILIE